MARTFPRHGRYQEWSNLQKKTAQSFSRREGILHWDARPCGGLVFGCGSPLRSREKRMLRDCLQSKGFRWLWVMLVHNDVVFVAVFCFGIFDCFKSVRSGYNVFGGWCEEQKGEKECKDCHGAKFFFELWHKSPDYPSSPKGQYNHFQLG